MTRSHSQGRAVDRRSYRRASVTADLTAGLLFAVLLLWILSLLFGAWQAVLMSDRLWPALPFLAMIPALALPFGRMVEGLWRRSLAAALVCVLIGLGHLIPAAMQLTGAVPPSVDSLLAGLPGLLFLAAPGILGNPAAGPRPDKTETGR